MEDMPRSDSTATPTGSAPRTGSYSPAGRSSTTPPARRSARRGLLWGLLAVVIAFSAGFLWQYSEARTARSELTATQQELGMERLRVDLGQAALAAQAGNFELSRQQMSSFFDALQERSAEMPDEVRGVATDFLAVRDDVITGLSRSNPEYGAVLYRMHEDLSAAIDRSLGAGAPAGDEPVPASGTEVDQAPGSGPEGTGP